MSDVRQTATFFGTRRTDAACLMVKLARRRWRALLLVTLVVLVCQGAVQHWHAPVHLAQQTHTLAADDDQHTDIDDLTDCQSCNLLKLSQVGAVTVINASLAVSAAPLAPVRRLWAVDLRLSQPAARGPPTLSSTLN